MTLAKMLHDTDTDTDLSDQELPDEVRIDFDEEQAILALVFEVALRNTDAWDSFIR